MSVFVFDSETTGVTEPVALVESALIELSIVGGLPIISKDGCIPHRWNPGRKIEYGAMATHMIEDADVADCPPAAGFHLPEGTEYIVGHNVDYDWKVIGEPPVKRICTLALARSLWPTLDSHKQLAVMYMLQPTRARELARNAHGAAADALMSAILLYRMAKKLGGIESWEQLWELSEDARIPKVMAFGKHKGAPVKELPSDYVSWLVKQPDMDPYLLKALR